MFGSVTVGRGALLLTLPWCGLIAIEGSLADVRARGTAGRQVTTFRHHGVTLKDLILYSQYITLMSLQKKTRQKVLVSSRRRKLF